MRFIAALFIGLLGVAFIVPQATSVQAQATNGSIRVIHAAAGSTGVDVYIDGTRVLNSRDYFTVSDPIALTPGTHEVRVTPTDSDTTLVGKVVTVDGNDAFTLALIGTPGNVDGLLLEDRSASVDQDEARIRFIHTATAAGAVDVKVDANSEPFLNALPYGGSSYIDVPVGTYAFDLIDDATGEVALRTIDFTFVPGWTYTFVVTGESADNLWVQASIDSTGN